MSEITMPEIEKVTVFVKSGCDEVDLCDFLDCGGLSCNYCAAFSAENLNRWRETLKEGES